jgi:hypothetical protein
MFENMLDGPIHAEPAGFLPLDLRRLLLVRELSGLALGSWDERILSWLAGWEPSTVVTVAAWLHRSRGGHRTPARPAVSCSRGQDRESSVQRQAAAVVPGPIAVVEDGAVTRR